MNCFTLVAECRPLSKSLPKLAEDETQVLLHLGLAGRDLEPDRQWREIAFLTELSFFWTFG